MTSNTATGTASDPPISDLDVVLGGGLSALTWLLAPAGETVDASVTEGYIDRLKAVQSKPIELRRLRKSLRVAALQGLMVVMMTHRGRSDVGLEPQEANWLREAERSIGAMLRGNDPLKATEPAGTFPIWSEIPETTFDGIAALDNPAYWRWRAEMVVRSDLELAMTPIAVPPTLFEQLARGSAAGHPSWLHAFSIFLVWQAQNKPPIASVLLGVSEADVERGDTQRVRALFWLIDRAEQLARELGEQFPADDGKPADLHPPAGTATTRRRDAELTAAHVLSATMGCAYPPVADMAMRLAGARLGVEHYGPLLRAGALMVRDLQRSWTAGALHPLPSATHCLAVADWNSLRATLEHEASLAASTAGRGASHLATIHAWRADAAFLAGDFAQASSLYTVAMEAVATGSEERARLNWKAAESTLVAGLVGCDAAMLLAARRAAEDCAERALAARHVAIARNAAVTAARSVLGSAKPSAADLLAVRSGLDRALADSDGQDFGPDGIELEAARIDVLLRLAGAEPKQRPTHLDDAEKAARALVSRPGDPAAPWLIGLGAAKLVHVLAQRVEGQAQAASVSETEELVVIADASLRQPAPAADPQLGARTQGCLGTAQWRLAKGPTRRARTEAAAIALARALPLASNEADRQRYIELLHAALLQLIKGDVGRHRFEQALRVADVAAEAPDDPHTAAAAADLLRSNANFALWKVAGSRTNADAAVQLAARGIQGFLGAQRWDRAASTAIRYSTILLDVGAVDRDPQATAAAVDFWQRIFETDWISKLTPSRFCQASLAHADALLANARMVGDAAIANRAVSEIHAQAYQAARRAGLEPMLRTIEAAQKKLRQQVATP